MMDKVKRRKRLQREAATLSTAIEELHKSLAAVESLVIAPLIARNNANKAVKAISIPEPLVEPIIAAPLVETLIKAEHRRNPDKYRRRKLRKSRKRRLRKRGRR